MNLPAAFSRLRPDLLAAHAAVFPQSSPRHTLAEHFARLKADLDEAWRAENSVPALASEAALVGELEQRWASITQKAFARVSEFGPLLAQLDLSCDPLAMPVDLLGLSGQSFDEEAHTQVLASLMQPGPANPIGAPLLRAFLGLVEQEEQTPAFFEQASVCAEVAAEHPDDRRGIRLDLVIEFEHSPERLLVVENKIRDNDRPGQLDGYEAWANHHARGRRTLLIYLTPDGRAPLNARRGSPWIELSYRSLLCAFRRALRDLTDNPWTAALRLYLATVARHVCRLRLTSDLHHPEKYGLLPYLRAAAGK